MEHKGTVPIKTERLILRRHRIEDAEYMFRNWTNSEAVTRYLTWETHKTVDDARQYIRSILDSYSDSRYEWIITDKATGEPLGAIGVVTLWENIGACEVGYCLGERFWGKGIMSEAFAAVIDYLFTQVGFNRIQSCHDPRNIGSGRVMEKCGLVYEGTLRQADRNNQGICDAVVRAILREDWEQQSAE